MFSAKVVLSKPPVSVHPLGAVDLAQAAESGRKELNGAWQTDKGVPVCKAWAQGSNSQLFPAKSS